MYFESESDKIWWIFVDIVINGFLMCKIIMV